MRAIIVGTTYNESGWYRSMSCSVRSASNFPPSTTWLPASSAVIVQMNGPLWYSGPGHHVRAVQLHPEQRRRVGVDQARLVREDQLGPTRSNHPRSSPCTGSTPRRARARRRSRRRRAGRSTTTRGAASSMIASSSRRGSRAETGCGTAPNFQHAIVVATNATPFGQRDRHEVVLGRRAGRRGPGPCDWPAPRARPESTVPCSSVSAGRSGSAATCCARRCGYEIRATNEILARRRTGGQPTSTTGPATAARSTRNRRRDGPRSRASWSRRTRSRRTSR